MSTRIASRTLVEKLPISRPSQYVCRACRQNIKTASNLVQQKRFASNGPKEETFIEKTRKKLWQGQPPGPENIDDVYGGPGFFATVAKERRLRKEKTNVSDATRPVEEKSLRRPQASGFAEDESVLEQPVATQAEFIEGASESNPKNARKPSQKLIQEVEGDLQQTRAEPESMIEEEPLPGTLAHEVETWQGLEVIGHEEGQWQLMPPVEADEYTPWQRMESKLKWTDDELIALMAIAAGEGSVEDTVFYPGDASLPLLSEAEKAAVLSQELSIKPQNNSLEMLSRFSYLVRRRIPDPVLTKIAKRDTTPTVQDFLALFAEKSKPRPANVAEVLLNNEKLAAHSNLLVFGRRETPVDKEKELGRWKVIEEQLRERGLPVLGRYRSRV